MFGFRWLKDTQGRVLITTGWTHKQKKRKENIEVSCLFMNIFTIVICHYTIFKIKL